MWIIGVTFPQPTRYLLRTPALSQLLGNVFVNIRIFKWFFIVSGFLLTTVCFSLGRDGDVDKDRMSVLVFNPTTITVNLSQNCPPGAA